MLLASSSSIVKFHSWPGGEAISLYKSSKNKESGLIKSISWSKDGTWLVFVPNKGSAEVITLKHNLKFLHSINIELPSCATFHNTTKKMIALGTRSGQVFLYDMKNKCVSKRLPSAGTCSAVKKIICNATDTHVIAACQAGQILLYNIVYCNLSSTYKVPNSHSVNGICSHSANYLAGCSEEGVVASWDINTNQLMSSFQAHIGPVEDLTFSPISKDLLASVGMDRYCSFFDVKANKTILKFVTERTPLSLDFAIDNSSIAIGSDNGYIFRYDIRNIKEPAHRFLAHEGAVKNLFFQKKCSEELLSFNKTLEEAAVIREIRETLNESVDSFFDCATSNSTIPQSTSVQPKIIEEDSFFMQIGLDSTISAREMSAKKIQRPPSSKSGQVTKENQENDISTNQEFAFVVSDIKSTLPHIVSYQTKQPEKDSFLVKCGITDTKLPEETLQKDVTSLQLDVYKTKAPLPYDTLVIEEKTFGEMATATSTPLLSNKLEILSSSKSVTLTDNSEQVFVGNLITTETKSCQTDGGIVDQIELENMKKELRYEIMDHTQAIQQQLFSLQWFVSSEFLAIREKIDNLQKNMHGDDANHNID